MQLEYKGDDEKIGRGVHEVELVRPWTMVSDVRNVYVMDVGAVRKLHYKDLQSFLSDWEGFECG